MITITRRLEFDAGHRLLRHEGKCAHVHGHRYVVELDCESMGELDLVGRVIDFSYVKWLVGGWIDEHLDHAFIVGFDDHKMITFLRENDQRFFMLTREPTAENIATHLIWIAGGLLAQHRISVPRLRLWETPNCSATVLNPGASLEARRLPSDV